MKKLKSWAFIVGFLSSLEVFHHLKSSLGFFVRSQAFLCGIFCNQILICNISHHEFLHSLPWGAFGSMHVGIILPLANILVMFISSGGKAMCYQFSHFHQWLPNVKESFFLLTYLSCLCKVLLMIVIIRILCAPSTSALYFISCAQGTSSFSTELKYSNGCI